MRQYRIAPWIVLILSIINFTIAVPVAVRGTHGVRVYMEDVANDKIPALQKRMDDDDDDEGTEGSNLSSEHARPYHGGPNSETDSNTDPNAEVSDDDDDDDDDDDGGDEHDGDQEEEDNNDDNQENQDQSDEEDSESDVEDDDADDEADGDTDDEEDDHESPPNSPESEHPAGYTYESKGLSGWGKLLKDVLRPRTSTSGVVDAPKRELQESDDTQASMVRDVSEFSNAPATSASNVIGRGEATSLYSLPSHSQSRKKWMLDKLD